MKGYIINMPADKNGKTTLIHVFKDDENAIWVGDLHGHRFTADFSHIESSYERFCYDMAVAVLESALSDALAGKWGTMENKDIFSNMQDILNAKDWTAEEWLSICNDFEEKYFA